MKKINLTEKKDEELTRMLAEKREALRTFRFNSAGSALRDVRAYRTDRKDVARILTELNARTN